MPRSRNGGPGLRGEASAIPIANASRFQWPGLDSLLPDASPGTTAVLMFASAVRRRSDPRSAMLGAGGADLPLGGVRHRPLRTAWRADSTKLARAVGRGRSVADPAEATMQQ